MDLISCEWEYMEYIIYVLTYSLESYGYIIRSKKLSPSNEWKHNNIMHCDTWYILFRLEHIDCNIRTKKISTLLLAYLFSSWILLDRYII